VTPRSVVARDTIPRVTELPFVAPRLRHGIDGAAFEECEHIVGDDDPDTALCGIDQTNVPWNQGFPVCQACLAVAQGRMN
jgi:hypothetical protein